MVAFVPFSTFCSARAGVLPGQSRFELSCPGGVAH